MSGYLSVTRLMAASQYAGVRLGVSNVRKLISLTSPPPVPPPLSCLTEHAVSTTAIVAPKAQTFLITGLLAALSRRISSDGSPDVTGFEKVYHLDTSDVYVSAPHKPANPATVETTSEGGRPMAQETETLQEVAETAIHHLSRIATILASAARDVVTELGEM